MNRRLIGAVIILIIALFLYLVFVYEIVPIEVFEPVILKIS